MWNRFVVWLTNYSLSRRNLSLKERNEIVRHILDNLQSLPLAGIISTNEGGEVLLNGEELDIEKIRVLKESARVVLENQAFKIINQEVLYLSVIKGLHQATSDNDLYFYRAAIWFGQQFEIQLKILAQRTE